MPGPNGNLSDLIRTAARNWPERAAIIQRGSSHTWAEFDRAVDTGAAELLEAGLRRGERVVVALSTSAETALALLAVTRAGGVAVPIDPELTDPADAARRAGAERQLGTDPAQITAWWSGSRAAVEPIGSGEDLALLAGSGRRERPVMISHRAVLAAVQAIVESGVDLREDDRGLLAMPLPHLAGFVTAFLPVATAGAAAVVQERGASVAETIRDHRVTILPGSPMVYHELLANPQAERALASVRLMTSGAAPLRPTEFAAMRALTGQPVWEGYGITEATCVVATSLRSGQARPGSVGLPVPGMELRIGTAEEAAGDEDAAGPQATAVGTIALRGPMLFSGYWPDGADGPDADGWFVTADLGYLDDQGELRLVDRADDLLSVAGFTVYPREIENAINEHPQVAESAVIGAGNQVVALVRPVQGASIVPDEIREFLDGRVAVFKLPGVVEQVSALPRTQLGRLDRPVAAAEYARRHGVSISTTADGPQLQPWVVALAGDLTTNDVSTKDVSTKDVATKDVSTKEAATDNSARPADQDSGEKPSAATDSAEGAPEGKSVVVPERAADLPELGAKLPRGDRDSAGGAADSEDTEDLFGPDYQ